MKQVGVYDAKTHLAKLLDEVEKGESVTITRHGRPVARLVPVPARRKRSVAKVIADIERFREGNTLGDITTRELVEDGRRH